MKPRKSKHKHITAYLFAWIVIQVVEGAIVPPPWSDPEKNPCASMPGGWQLIYWPPLKKCFKIFSIGFPCPETMELSPSSHVATTKKSPSIMAQNPIAECRCPPGTAMSALTNKCHKIFERGPCEGGQYFSPLNTPTALSARSHKNRTQIRWGRCKELSPCNRGSLFWPQDGKCYTQYSRGPCFKGKLLVLNEDGLAECKCENTNELSAYFYIEQETCYEHFTRGPCSTPGHLFLPGGRCGCHNHLPHYYAELQMCFELDTPGPCPRGHIFSISQKSANASSTVVRGQCQCKDGYVPWTDGICYRLYTRGPCGPNEFLLNATSCVQNFCGKTRLYFPEQKSCYRIGSPGPCPLHQVVVFDLNTRPSVDGISYNGMCGCSGIIKNLDQQCQSPIEDEFNIHMTDDCEATPGMVLLNGKCHKLYTRGPCAIGQWLEAVRPHTVAESKVVEKAKCVCRPGYTPAHKFAGNQNNAVVDADVLQQPCNSATVGLARYLNNFRNHHHTAEQHLTNHLPTDTLSFAKLFAISVN